MSTQHGEIKHTTALPEVKKKRQRGRKKGSKNRIKNGNGDSEEEEWMPNRSQEKSHHLEFFVALDEKRILLEEKKNNQQKKERLKKSSSHIPEEINIMTSKKSTRTTNCKILENQIKIENKMKFKKQNIAFDNKDPTQAIESNLMEKINNNTTTIIVSFYPLRIFVFIPFFPSEIKTRENTAGKNAASADKHYDRGKHRGKHSFPLFPPVNKTMPRAYSAVSEIPYYRTFFSKDLLLFFLAKTKNSFHVKKRTKTVRYLVK